MSTPLHLLMLENQPDDTEQILNELRKAGYFFDYLSVKTEADFIHALGEEIDLIVAFSDCPHVGSMLALDLVKERHLDIPIILISTRIDDEIAVQAIKRGAADTITLDQLDVFIASVSRALLNKRLRLKNQQVEKALYESEVTLNRLVQQSFDGIVVANQDGFIKEWNTSLENITGISRESAIDKLLWDIMYQVQLPKFKTEDHQRFIKESYFQAFEKQSAPWFYKADVREIQHLDGSRKFVESVTFPVKAGAAFLLGSVIRDVTERVQDEQEIRHQADRANALLRVAGQLNAKLDLETVLNVVCKESAMALEVPLTTVMLYDAANDHLVQSAAYNITTVNPIQPPPIPLPVFESYAPTDQPVTVLHDLRLHTEWELANLHEYLDARTAVFLRMSHANRFMGILGVYTCGQVREFNEDELTLLEGFANQAAVAIYNAWLFEKVGQGRKNLEALSRRLVDIQEEERRMLARELHDEVGQALTGLKMLFDTLPALPEPVRERLRVGRSLVVDLIERTRRISLDLRPSMLDDLGLLPALLWHVERCREQSQLVIDFKHAGLERRFSPAVETAAYRIVQEGSTNIIRHAGVQQANIHVWVDEESLHIKVEDHGVGFDHYSMGLNGSGGGLSGMRERAVLAGGSFTVDSQPSKGTTLIARLPLQDRLERRIDERY